LKRKDERAQEVKNRLKFEASVKLLNVQLAEKSHQLDRKSQEVKDLRKKLSVAPKGSSIEDQLAYCIEQSVSRVLPGKHAHTKAKLLLDVIQSGKVFKGEASAALFECTKSYVKELFRPWRILKACDVSPVGAFKMSSLKALQNVIDENNVGLFPSTTSLGRVRKLLDDHASNLVGYRQKLTKYGEVYFLNFEKTLRLLLKACNLHERATRVSVKVAMSVDGADLVRDRTHVSAGMKITDENGFHPITKQPLFVTSEEGENWYVKIQSSEVCCLMVIALAKDNKTLYEDVFKEFYRWGERLKVEGLPASNGEPALKPFILTHTCDLKASWYLSNRGGGCKTKKFLCTLCSCSRHHLTSYNVDDFRCDRCKRRGKSKCYHHSVHDSVSTGETSGRIKDRTWFLCQKTWQNIC
jgi:hypothetical protein